MMSLFRWMSPPPPQARWPERVTPSRTAYDQDMAWATPTETHFSGTVWGGSPRKDTWVPRAHSAPFGEAPPFLAPLPFAGPELARFYCFKQTFYFPGAPNSCRHRAATPLQLYLETRPHFLPASTQSSSSRPPHLLQRPGLWSPESTRSDPPWTGVSGPSSKGTLGGSRGPANGQPARVTAGTVGLPWAKEASLCWVLLLDEG